LLPGEEVDQERTFTRQKQACSNVPSPGVFEEWSEVAVGCGWRHKSIAGGVAGPSYSYLEREKGLVIKGEKEKAVVGHLDVVRKKN